MNRVLIPLFQVLVIMLALGIILPVTAADTGLLYPLKPTPQNGPYDDKKFMEVATTEIMGLSGKMIPTEGTDLLNLKSTQLQISRMNISPNHYPEASIINAYLYKIGQAGDAYGTTKSLTDHPNNSWKSNL